MSELTTERLDKLQDNLLQFQDHYSDPADKENYDIFVDALHVIDEFKIAKEKILAYEQAAKNKVALPEALMYAEIYGRAFICVDRNGSVHAVDPSQITITILNEPANAQPVIPEQELNTAKLINKFYERYPLETFANDSERAEALGYFMAGAELQCFGEFIAYDDHMQESE